MDKAFNLLFLYLGENGRKDFIHIKKDRWEFYIFLIKYKLKQ